MGDLLGSTCVATVFRFFFFFKSADPFHFICCGGRMRPDQDEERASKSGLLAMFTRNCQKVPYGRLLALKTTSDAFVYNNARTKPTLARGDEGGRATVRKARLTRRFRAASYELATSLELARFMRNSAVAYIKFNICSARTRWVRSYRH